MPRGAFRTFLEVVVGADFRFLTLLHEVVIDCAYFPALVWNGDCFPRNNAITSWKCRHFQDVMALFRGKQSPFQTSAGKYAQSITTSCRSVRNRKSAPTTTSRKVRKAPRGMRR